jgi:3-oxoadipate enol-lactonase
MAVPIIDLNDASITYDVEGEGPWLVLLHEIGGTRESWAVVSSILAKRFKVVRYDQRGCGDSSKISDAFQMETHVSDLRALLDKLGIQQAHVAGVALGAALAARFATDAMRRVQSLVLACPAPGADADRVKYLEQRAAAVELEGMIATAKNSLANSYPPEARRDPAAFEAYKRRFLANDPKSYAAINRAFPAFNVEADLTQLRCPTLVLAGRHDKLRPPPFVREVADSIPGAVYQEIDSGHIMPVQAPAEMAAAMAAFHDKLAMKLVAKSP